MSRRKRSPSDRVTALELEIMEVLWAHGAATTHVVQKFATSLRKNWSRLPERMRRFEVITDVQD
jgi:hypothetical protein